MAYACYHCGKEIKGTVKHTSPPLYLERLGLDFPKSFHPVCYDKAEAEAAELIRLVTGPWPEDTK